jgi:Tat protein secretion system quality control protein TatD with DNase activity
MQHTSNIPGLKARALIVMATRRQDQELVSEVVEKYGVDEDVRREEMRWDSQEGYSREQGGRREVSKEWKGAIPSYGWHPWFSHQIYDDSDLRYQHVDASASSIAHYEATNVPRQLTQSQHISHYSSVLTPSPSDEDFLTSLPPPMPLSKLLQDTRRRLKSHPLALLGEVGLDRQFRLPAAWQSGEQEAFRQQDGEGLTSGGREGRKLSPYRVDMQHQKLVLTKQLELAGELGRAVSCHGVQCHGVLWDVLSSSWKGHERKTPSKKQAKKAAEKKIELDKSERKSSITQEELEQGEQDKKNRPYPPRICLHSFSGPPEQAKLYLSPTIPAEIYFSFSLAINFPSSFDNNDSSDLPAEKKAAEVIKMLPEDKILIESDMHIAGDRMDQNLRGMARKVCEVRGWTLEDGVGRLARNWEVFVFGGGEDREKGA